MVGLLGVVDRGEDLLHLHLGVLLADLGELGLHVVVDRNVRGALGLGHPEGGGGASVEARERADFAHAVAHVREVREPREAPPGQHDLGVAECRSGARPAEHADRLLAATELRPPAGRIEVEVAQLVVDLNGRDAECLHARRIELDADLAVDAATALHLRDTGNAEQPLGDRVIDEPGQLLLGERARADAVVDDRWAVGVDALHYRLLDALRQLRAHLGNRVAHVGDRAVYRRADVELDRDVGLALGRPRGDVVDVADAGDGALDLLDDLRFQVLRRCARLRDRDVHQRKRDVGVQRDGQPDERRDAHEEQHHEQHHRRQRMPDGPCGHVSHGGGCDTSVVTVTASPSRRKPPAVLTTRSLPVRPEAMTTPSAEVSATRTACRVAWP